MRRFRLQRDNGPREAKAIAEGVLFTNGKAVLSWIETLQGISVYDTLEAALSANGHGYQTRVVMLDEPVVAETAVDASQSPSGVGSGASKRIPSPRSSRQGGRSRAE